MHILSFLVNFNANLFALDNEFHTAMDVAASRDRMDCVRFLDASASQRTTKDPKRVVTLKKEATKEAEKRVKLCEKVKKRHQTKMDKMYQSNGGSISKKGAGAQTSTTGSLSNEQFSKLINSKPSSGSLSASVMGTLQRFGKKDKGGTLTKGGDGNVVFGTQGNPEFLDVFSEQDENEEETEDSNRGEDEEEEAQNKLSIFNRPGLGGLTFMKKLGVEADDMADESNENLGYLVQNDIFGAGDDDGGAGGFDADVPWEQDELGLDDELDEETSPLDTFLSTLSLQEFTVAFNREKLDLEALLLCSDDDLKGIRIQLGPRKKILEAAARRTSALSNPGKMRVTAL